MKILLFWNFGIFFYIIFFQLIHVTQSVSGYCFRHFLVISLINAHTFPRRTFEITEISREFQVCPIYPERIDKNKNIFLTKFKILHLLSIQKSFGKPRTISRHYHLGLLCRLRRKVSPDLLFLDVYFNLKRQLFIEWAFRNRNPQLFS